MTARSPAALTRAELTAWGEQFGLSIEVRGAHARRDIWTNDDGRGPDLDVGALPRPLGAINVGENERLRQVRRNTMFEGGRVEPDCLSD